MAGVNMSRQQKEAEEQITDGQAKITDGEKQLTDAEQQIADAKAEIKKIENPEVVCADERGCTDGISRIRR